MSAFESRVKRVAQLSALFFAGYAAWTVIDVTIITVNRVQTDSPLLEYGLLNYRILVYAAMLLVCSFFYWKVSKGAVFLGKNGLKVFSVLLSISVIFIMIVGNLVNFGLLSDFANINQVDGVGKVGWSVLIGLGVLLISVFSIVSLLSEKFRHYYTDRFINK